MRPSPFIPLLGAAVAAAATARAEGPVPQGTFALGAERLTGFFHTSMDPEGGDSESYDEVTVLGNFTIAGILGSPGSIPRVGLDGFVSDGLSIGGSAMIAHMSRDNFALTAILLHPRVGYATFFSEQVGIWPRIGLSYLRLSSDPDRGDGETQSHIGLELEAPLLFAASEDVWLHVGPIVGIPLSGTADNGPGPDRDLKFTVFGIAAGITAAL